MKTIPIFFEFKVPRFLLIYSFSDCALLGDWTLVISPRLEQLIANLATSNVSLYVLLKLMFIINSL